MAANEKYLTKSETPFITGTGMYSAEQQTDARKYTGNYAVSEGTASAYGDFSHAEGNSITFFDYNGAYEVRKLTETEISNVNMRYGRDFSGTVYIALDAWDDFAYLGRIVYDASEDACIALIPESQIDYVGVTGNYYGTMFTTTKPISAVTSTTNTVSVDFATPNYGAFGMSSHVEGGNTLAKTEFSHAEGQETIANGKVSHAEGYSTRANGTHSHAEGQETIAKGNASHAEGYSTHADGVYSHSGGLSSSASTSASFAHGSYVQASANTEGAVALGRYNAIGWVKTVSRGATSNINRNSNSAYNDQIFFSIGCGNSASENGTNRRQNAFFVTASGAVFCLSSQKSYTYISTVGATESTADVYIRL